MIVESNGRIKQVDEAKGKNLLAKGWNELKGETLKEVLSNKCISDDSDIKFLCVPEMSPDDEIYGYQIVYKTLKRGLAEHNVILAETTQAYRNHFHITPPYNTSSVIKQVNGGVKRALLTMWETEQIYPHWAEPINDSIDVVFVPSTYLVEAFKKIGVTKPIELLPLGIQEVYFNYKERSYKKGDKFRLIHWNSGEPRKGYYELVEAWGKYFGDREDMELILKQSTRTDPRHINLAFEHAGYEPNQFANVTKINEPYTTDQMIELLHSCHALVYPSCGEGYGYTPREAMATGLPVIMTDEHAFKDIPKEMFYHVKSSLAKAKRQYKDFEWYKPDVEDIATQINNLMKNYTKAKAKAKKAYTYVDKHEHVNDIITNILIPKLKEHELI